MGDYRQEYAFVDSTNVTWDSRCPIDFQMSSDPEKLKSFLERQQNPSKEMKTYLEARIEASEHFEKLRKNKSHNKGPAAKLIEQDGKSFLNLDMPQNQTAENGCWSVSIGMMLKSRGVDVPQEMIRAYRSPYADNKQGTVQSYTMDKGGMLTERLDLISDVLPNTLVRSKQYSIEVKKDEKTGEQLNLDNRNELADALYRDVETAITEKNSPVSLRINGHIRTAIGVDKANKAILFKDSKEAPANQTFSCTADEMIEMATSGWGAGNDLHFFTLEWLEDVKQEEGVKVGTNTFEYEKGEDGNFTVKGFKKEKKNENNLTNGINISKIADGINCSEIVFYPEKLEKIEEYKKIPAPKVAKGRARYWDAEHPFLGKPVDLPKVFEPEEMEQNPQKLENPGGETEEFNEQEHKDFAARINKFNELFVQKIHPQQPEKIEEETKPEKKEEVKPEEKKEEEKKPAVQEPQKTEPLKTEPQKTEPLKQGPQMPGAQMPQTQMPGVQWQWAQMPQAQTPQAQKPAEEKASDAESTLAMQKKELEKMILNKPEQPERPSLWDYIKDWFGIGGKRNEKCVKWEEYKKELKKWKKDIREKGAQLHNDEMKEMVRKGMQQGNYASQMQETQKEGPTLSSYAGIQNDSKADVVPAEKTTTTPLQQTETEKEPLPDEKELEEQSKKEVDDLLKKLKDANGGDLPDEVVKNVKNLSDGARQGQLKIQEQIKEHENVSDPRKKYFYAGVNFQMIIAYESFKSAVMDGKANETLLNQMKDEKFYVKWQAMALTSKDVQHYNGINGIKHTPDDYRKALSKQSKETMAYGLNQELVERAEKYNKEKALWLCQSNDKKIEIQVEQTQNDKKDKTAENKPDDLKKPKKQDQELETYMNDMKKKQNKTLQKNNEKQQTKQKNNETLQKQMLTQEDIVKEFAPL